MSTYFDQTTNRIAEGSLARSSQVNDLRDDTGVGFAMLPEPDDLKKGTSTYGTDAGTANAYVVTMTNPITAYSVGHEVVFIPANSNTGGSVINVDGLGNLALKKPDGNDLVTGDLIAGYIYSVRNNGSFYQMVGYSAADAYAIAAAASAAAAAVSKANAATSETNAATSETNAATSETNAAASAAEVTGLLQVYDSGKTYNANEVVQKTTGEAFISQAGSNTGNDPDTNPTWWKCRSIRIWTSPKVFGQYEICQYTDGTFWRSLIADNTTNDPSSDDGTKWEPAVQEKLVNVTSVSDTLTAFRENVVRSAGTYYLPLANTVPDGGWVDVSIEEIAKTAEQIISRSGSDLIYTNESVDTDITYDTESKLTDRYYSNGNASWRI